MGPDGSSHAHFLRAPRKGARHMPGPERVHAATVGTGWRIREPPRLDKEFKRTYCIPPNPMSK